MLSPKSPGRVRGPRVLRLAPPPNAIYEIGSYRNRAKLSSMRLLLIFALLFVAFRHCSAASAALDSARLTVSNHFVLLDGKRYRGIGVNYFSLASRVLKNPNESSSLSNLTVLARLDIPFARFMC